MTTRSALELSRLQAAVEGATRDQDRISSFLAVERAGRVGLQVAVDPLDGFEGLHLATVTVRDPESYLARQARRAAVRFGYTGAEAALAEALLRGVSPAQHARACGVSLPTIRSHLRALLAKSGAKRQAQLVAHILTVPIH